MTRGAGFAIVVAAMAALLAHETRSVQLDGETTLRAVENVVGYIVVLATAVLVTTRGQRPRLGLLMVAWIVAGLLGDMWFLFPDSVMAMTLFTPLLYLSAAVYVHMVLAYPTGRLTDRLDRIAVVAVYGVSLIPGIALVLTWDPNDCPECIPRVSSPFLIDGADTFFWLDLAKGLTIVAAVAFLALLVRRFSNAPTGARRSLWPLGVAALVAVIQFVVRTGAEIAELWGWVPTLDWLDFVTTLGVPVSLAAGILLSNRAGRSVADRVADLGLARPGHVEEALAEAVGDPSLRLVLWDPEGQGWISPQGRPVALPSDSTQTVTMIGSDLAAVIHDPDLADQRRLVASAGSAAQLALENERLQAELRARLDELRASRARIVTAGDDERRRLERDLHDGAQQRLLGVGLALQLLRPRLGAEEEAEPVLTDAEDELRAALSELRELARGIHPAVLTEQGLETALRTLAGRSHIPVTLEARPDELAGLPVTVQTALYYVAAEALANVAKHADANTAWVTVNRSNGSVTLEVADDGAGGADPRAGSGLTGLSDRVGALGGTMTVASPPGSGTKLKAEVPCASS